jgi:hypothetical protein
VAPETGTPWRSIVAAGFSGTGGNLALAEYLPRNHILVVSPLGGPPPAPGGGAAFALSPWDVEEDDEEDDAAGLLVLSS